MLQETEKLTTPPDTETRVGALDFEPPTFALGDELPDRSGPGWVLFQHNKGGLKQLIVVRGIEKLVSVAY